MNAPNSLRPISAVGQEKRRTGLFTLLFTDVAGSTQLKATLGDQPGVSLIQSHHLLVRKLLESFTEAEEISVAGDSFLLVFSKPSDALRFALQLQGRLRDFNRDRAFAVEDRIGLHMGEVVIEEREGRRDVHGMQVDACARVMSLAQAGQILMTRPVFDNARQTLKGEEITGVSTLEWLNHGRFELKGLGEPVEICEVRAAGGGKLRAPITSEKARRAEAAEGEAVLGWRPAVGQVVPNTQWVLEEKLGEGGFGEVWLGCHQVMKERRVFKFCFRADRVRSLKREMTLFRMIKERIGDHPNIVALREVYFEQPPFYVEEDYVPSQDLAGWCAAQGGADKVPLETRLELVAQIADALQAAHDAGVIHRDVKPANILVSDQGTVTSGKRQVPPKECSGSSEQTEVAHSLAANRGSSICAKLTDFGIGQVISEEALAGVTKAGFTQTMLSSGSSLAGTQIYLAPELLAGKPASTRSDIYSLGVVLYQLIVGDFTCPVTTDWVGAVSDRLLREDLGRCFAGNPQQRFAAAGQLAESLRALPQRRKELAAREHAELVARRRRAITLASGAVALVLFLLAVVLLYGLRRAESEARIARQNLYAADMRLALQAWEEGNLHRAQTLLGAHLPEADGEDLRGFEWRYLSKLCRDESRYWFTNFDHEIRSLAFWPGTNLLAVASGKMVTFLDISGRREAGVLQEPDGWISALAFSPAASNVLATAVYCVETRERFNPTLALKTSQVPAFPRGKSVVKLWNLTTRELIAVLPGHTAEIACITFSGDGKRLASASWDGTVRLWDVATGSLLQKLNFENPAIATAFTPDGASLISHPSKGSGISVCDVATGKQFASYRGSHAAWLLALALSPGGETLATVANDGQVILWDLPAYRQRAVMTGHQGPIESVAFAPKGKLLATAGEDNTVRLWDTLLERQVAILRGHAAPVTAVAFTPDGETLVSGAVDRTVKVWDAIRRTDANLLREVPDWSDAAVFTSDGKTLASVFWSGNRVILWDIPSRRLLADLVGHTNAVRCAAFSPDGRILATGSHDYTVKLWELATRKMIGDLTNEFGVCSVGFSADGKILAAAGDGVAFWDIASRKKVDGVTGDTRGVYSVAFSPIGGYVAAGYPDGRVVLWDFPSRRLLASFKQHNTQVKSVAFSNDGTLLASGGHDTTVVLYDVAARRVIDTLRGNTFVVHCVAFSPDNKTLASAGWDGTVRLWNLASRQLALTLRGHQGPVAGVAFTRDGSLMATCGSDGNVHLWPAVPLAEIETSKSADAPR